MKTTVGEDRLKEFLLVLRRALLVVVRWIEQEYGLEPSGRKGAAQAPPRKSNGVR